MRLSVVVPSCGRETLDRTLRSCAGFDEILVDRNSDGDFGNQARSRMQRFATGDLVCFIDDDDAYVEGAAEIIRANVGADIGSPHIFQMRYQDGSVLWAQRAVVVANIGSPMFVVPNGALPDWTDRYEADFDFIAAVCAAAEPVWHETVIALVRPSL